MSGRVHHLENNTARLITSNQVIQGPYNAVKELVENALDAHATSIEVRLENFGLDKVEVKDNGSGIGKSDVALMFRPGHSSKIKDFADLEKLSTYGFRGEALAALCCIAQCAVTTKTNKDAVASSFKFDSDGNVIDSKPSHSSQGTAITVSQLFCHQPARRRMLLSGKGGAAIGSSKSASLSQIRNYLGALGVAWPEVRISLIHNGSLVWRKQPVAANTPNTLIKALGEAIGHTQASNLHHLTSTMDTGETINLLVPKVGCKIKDICQSSKAAMVIIINKRVLHHKKIESVLLHHFRSFFSDIGQHKYPVCVADLQLQAADIDINLEPDKSKLFMRSEKETCLIEDLQKLLNSYYAESQTTKSIEDRETDLCELNQENNFEPIVKKARIESVPEDTDVILPSTNTTSASVSGYSVEIIGETNLETNVENHIEELNHKEKVESSSSSQVSDITNASSYLCSTQSSISNPLDSPHEELNNLLNTSSDLSEEQIEALTELEKLYENPTVDKIMTPEPQEKSVPATDVQLDAWSRGQLKTSSGTVEGCGVLTPGPVPLQQIMPNYEAEASPSSQMGCKELAGFSLFCKRERPKILQEHPGVVFTMVAQMLARRWKELPTIEKVRYGELAKELKLVKKTNYLHKPKSPQISKVPALSRKSLNSEKVMPRTSNTTISLITKKVNSDVPPEDKTPVTPELETQKTKQKTSSRVPRNEIQFEFNITTMEKIAINSTSPTTTALPFEIVGKLESCILLKHGSYIDLLNPWVLRETLLLKRLLSEMVLPVTQLAAPLLISPEDIGWKAWLSLSSLETTWDVMSNCTYVSSPLITSNGFRITVLKEEGSSELTNAQITHITTVVDSYGVDNLQELLLLIAATPKCTIQQSRCQSTLDYLKKLAKTGSTSETEADLEELLDQWNLLSIDDTHCFHGKEIFVHLTSVRKRKVNPQFI